MAKEAINYEDLNEESQFPIGLGLTDEVYGQCLDILAKGDEYIDDLDPILEALHPADIADLIERLPLNKRELLLTHIPPDYLGETIAHLHDEAQEATLTSVINTVSPEGLLEAVESLESDDRTNLLRAVEERQGIVYEEEQKGDFVSESDSQPSILEEFVEIQDFEIENEIVFRYFDRLPSIERNDKFFRAIYIGVLALMEDRLSSFLSKTTNELGTELESLKIIFDMKKELF